MGSASQTVSSRSPSDPPDRRRSPRKPHVVQALLSSPTGGERVEVVSTDINRHGICLTLRRPIPAGTYHRLEPSSAATTPAREIRVLACTAQPDGTFLAHAEFA